MKYWITKHIEGMDTPMFRINYSSQYHTGSHPITNYSDAINFIAKEFGLGQLTYAMKCFRTEVAEMLFKTCKEMVADKVWKEEDIEIYEFFKAFRTSNYIETVTTLNGLEVEMHLLKTYDNGKLFFAQERLCLTDMNNQEINSLDIINYLMDIL